MKYALLPALVLAGALYADDKCCVTETNCKLVYPSCRFETQCGFGTYVTAEALFWIPKVNGLIIAQEGAPGPGPQTGSVPTTSFNFRGNLLRIDPDFDWGFRIGLGYNFCFDEWDAKAAWTSFQTDQSAHFISDGNTFAINLWGHSDVSNSSASSLVKAHYDFDYNTLDFELGRGFGAGRCFCLRPFFGIRAAWIDQTLTDFNQVELEGNTSQILSTQLKAHSDFTGAGLRFGLDGRFDFGMNFSLYGLANYSLLYGSFDASFTSYVSGADPSESLEPVEDLVIADACDRFHMGVSSLSLTLGLQWNRGFCCDRYRLGLHVGWEQNLWFQLNQMNHFQYEFHEGHLNQENGNLSLQGISFGTRFDF